MKYPETRYKLFFLDEAATEAALGDLGWREDDYHGEIISGCDRNGTPCSLTIWCRPCSLEGLRHIAEEVHALRVTDENGNAI